MKQKQSPKSTTDTTVVLTTHEPRPVVAEPHSIGELNVGIYGGGGDNITT